MLFNLKVSGVFVDNSLFCTYGVVLEESAITNLSIKTPERLFLQGAPDFRGLTHQKLIGMTYLIFGSLPGLIDQFF